MGFNKNILVKTKLQNHKSCSNELIIDDAGGGDVGDGCWSMRVLNAVKFYFCLKNFFYNFVFALLLYIIPENISIWILRKIFIKGWY